jgi:hypothetical protein
MNAGSSHGGREKDARLEHVGGEAGCRREDRAPSERHAEERQLG